MVTVKPFKGVRYNLEKVLLKNVIAPPYDVISKQMREALNTKSPYNVVNLILPEGDDKYKKAGELYNELKSQEILLKDGEASFYVYEQEYEVDGVNYVRTGFIGLLGLEELGKGKVFPHEKTLSGPKEDRFNLMKECKTNFSQIFGLYMDKENKMDNLFSTIKKSMPMASAVDLDGVKNTIWNISDMSIIEDIESFMQNKNLYIADGHHRYETALNFKKYMRDKNGDAPDSVKPYDFVMTMFVNFYDEGLKIFPTHRVVKVDEGFDEGVFLDKISKSFDIIPLSFDEKDNFFYENGGSKIVFKNMDKYYGFILKNNVYNELHHIYRNINTYILQEVILKGVLGFGDEKILKKEGIYFVQSEESADKIAESQRVVTFFLKGLNIEAVREVSEAGLVMPQKSTYFYPKLQTGLVINEF